MSLKDVRWLNLQDVVDSRGRLTAVESGVQIPFTIARVFYIHQVQPGIDRGGHAHQDTDQVAVAVHGWLKIDLSDGIETQTYHLDRPDQGLYVPRQIFTRLYDFSPEAVCLVLASTLYDRSKSIRTWEDFIVYRGLSEIDEPTAQT
jgi:dTDP-4-dehydrorhamnose 3,5-epimerase-like enzyme